MSAVHRWSSSALAAVVLLASTALLPTAAAAAGQDSTPPAVVSFSFSAPSVDVTSAAQSVTARARITDGGSGVALPISGGLWSDTAPQYAGEPTVRRVSGTAFDGTYEFTWSLMRGAAPGPWTASISASDAAGNTNYGDEGTAVLTVVNRGVADITAPEVVAFEVSPASVDVRTADQRVTVRARIVDAGTGVIPPFIDVWLPETGMSLAWGELERTSGTAQDGWYEWSTTVPRGTMAGSWTIDLWPLVDQQGNEGWFGGTEFDATLDVFYSASADVTAPRVESLTVTPSTLDPGDPLAAITIRARVTDAGAGVVQPELLLAPETMARMDAGARAALERPVGAIAAASDGLDTAADAGADGGAGYWETVVMERVSGSANDGVYEWTGTPDGAWEFPGRWTVALDALRDYAGNVASGVQPTASFTITQPRELERLAGADRFSTAAAVAARFPAGVPTVYIAYGANFPDALAGAALAGREGAPILLALRDQVPASTLRALERLDPQNIVILGGLPTLSQAVANQLAPYGSVSRIAGADRYATGALIADRFEAGAETVYVASGRNFPDALAGAAVAGATGSPVLLTDPQHLPSSVAAQLDRLEPRRIVLLGGTPSVSAAVEAELSAFGAVERIAGADRFETASLVAADLGHVDRVYVASGGNFPDALAGAALAGAQRAPVLLALRDYLPPSTQARIESSTPRQVLVLGDANAISDSVADRMAALVR